MKLYKNKATPVKLLVFNFPSNVNSLEWVFMSPENNSTVGNIIHIYTHNVITIRN